MSAPLLLALSREEVIKILRQLMPQDVKTLNQLTEKKYGEYDPDHGIFVWDLEYLRSDRVSDVIIENILHLVLADYR